MSGLAELVETVERTIGHVDAADHRRMLLGVTDLLMGSSASLSEDHVHAFDVVMGRLIGKAETEARQAVAERLVTLPTPPAALVRRLAADTAGTVAGPILSSRLPIPDTALVRLADSRSQAHLRAIAERPALSESVCEAVAAKGDEAVLTTLLANTGARLSEKALSLAATRIADETALATALAQRSDLDPQRRAALMREGRAQRARAATEASPQKVKDRARAEVAVASRIRIGLDETDITHWLDIGRLTEALCALAHRARVTSDDVLAAHARPESRDMTLLVRWAGLHRATLLRYLLVRPRAGRRHLREMLTLFDTTSVAQARRLLEQDGFRIGPEDSGPKGPSSTVNPPDMR